MFLVLLLLILLVGGGVVGYLAFSVPEDQDEETLDETETGDEDEDEENYGGGGGDYATFDETEDQDGDYVVFDEDDQDPTSQDPTVSNPDFDEQNTICQDITNPFCGRTITQDFKLEPRDLGEWAGPQITVMMRLELEGNGERTKAGLFFKKDGTTQFEGQRNLDATVQQEGSSWIITVPLGNQHRIILNGGMIATGLIPDGMDTHGFYEKDTDGEIVQKNSLMFVYSPPQNLRFLRTKEMDFIVEDLVDEYNDKIRSFLVRQNGGLEVKRSKHSYKFGGNEVEHATRFMPNQWYLNTDSDGYININTSHSHHRGGMKNDTSTYWWPQGFKLGGKNISDDNSHRHPGGKCQNRVFEVRRNSIYKAHDCNSSNIFGAMSSTRQGIHQGLGVNSLHLGKARRIEGGWFKQSHISWKTNDNLNGIWSNRNHAPTDIYLAFDLSDQDYWANKLPIKPQREERTLMSIDDRVVPTIPQQGYENDVEVQEPEFIAVLKN